MKYEYEIYHSMKAAVKNSNCQMLVMLNIRIFVTRS